MSKMNTHFLVVTITSVIILLFGMIIGVNYYIHNYQTGYYDYTISTDGLSDYCGGL